MEGGPNWPAGVSSDDSVDLRYGDGVSNAAEGVVAAVAAAGGDNEVVFAAGDWVAEDELVVNLFS